MNDQSVDLLFTGIVLMDQGGAIMNIQNDMVDTLRANMKHHEPIILFVRESGVSDCP